MVLENLMQRRMSLASYLTPCIKITFKWIKDLNMKPETVNNTRQKVYRKSFLTFFFDIILIQ